MRIRLFVYLSVIAVFVLPGCKALNKLTQFNIDYHTSFTYPANLPINLPGNTNTPDITTNADQQFAIKDTRKDLIQSIKLKQLTLTITDPSTQTFSFLKSVDVYISAPGLPETQVAHKDNIPANVGNTLDLDLFDVELRDYIKADNFNLRITSVTDEIITHAVTVDIYTKFFVDAKILGI